MLLYRSVAGKMFYIITYNTDRNKYINKNKDESIFI